MGRSASASLPFQTVSLKYRPRADPSFVNPFSPGSPLQRCASMNYGLSPRAMIRDDTGRIVSPRRSRECTYWPGKWELAGAKLDPGENIFFYLDREALE